jgi:YD repeat-containing protein
MQFDTRSLGTNNRLYAPSDLDLPDNERRMRYDAAGNLTRDTYTGAGDRVYDTENRMTQASSMQGRFTSTDPLYIEMGRLGDPQQFQSLFLHSKQSAEVYRSIRA